MLIRSPLLSRHGFAHGFTDRLGGVSVAPFDELNLARNVGDDAGAVAENHRRVAAAVGYDAAALHEVNQVHGAAVRAVGAADGQAVSRAADADAVVSGEVPVAIRIADCLPLLVADVRTGRVAAVHVGWRGAVAGVVHAALDVLGGEPADLIAAIGPHIRAAAFEVGDEVAAELATAGAKVGADSGVIVRGYAKPHVDLAALVRAQLRARGVGEARTDDPRVDDVGGCTHAEAARFFSFRRDGKAAGRQAAVIVPRRAGSAAEPAV
jgi:YfiH family protein